MRKIINLTPHALNIVSREGDEIIVPPSGHVARIQCEHVYSHTIYTEQGDVDIFVSEYGELEGLDLPILPDAYAIYIVSSICLEKCKELYRLSTFASPGELIRNEQGQPVGCKGLKY